MMERHDLPNDLDLDYSRLKEILLSALDQSIDLGVEKARVELFAILRDLMQEKDQEGDAIAAQVIEWVWLQLAERYPNQ